MKHSFKDKGVPKCNLGTSRLSINRAGFTLIEMLFYVALLAIAINICATIFVKGTRLTAMGTEKIDRMYEVLEVQREFHEALRECEVVVAKAGTQRSGDQQVVLRRRTQEGGTGYVAFGDLRGDGRFSRMDLTARDGAFKVAYLTTYRLPVENVRFDYGAAAVTAARRVGLDFTIRRPEDDQAKNPVTYRLTAALRSHGGSPQ